MDEACHEVNGPGCSPQLRPASIRQWIGKSLPIDEKSRDVGIDAADAFNKTLDIATGREPKAQPFFQQFLRMDGLLKGCAGIPFREENRIGFRKDLLELALLPVTGKWAVITQRLARDPIEDGDCPLMFKPLKCQLRDVLARKGTWSVLEGDIVPGYFIGF